MSDINKALEQAKKALEEAVIQKKLSQEILKNLGPAVIETIKPALEEIAKNSKLSKEELIDALSKIKIDIPKADIPKAEVEVKIPEIKIPEPKVIVNVPKIETPKIPEIKIPAIKVPKPEVTVNIPKFPEFPKFPEEMDIKGWVNLMSYDKGFLHNPLPVQIRDVNGKPIDFGGSITQILGAGGGKHDFYTIKGFSQSAYAELMNADGRLRVSVETGGSGLTDAELRAIAVPVSQVSGASWSTEATQAGTWNIATVTGITNSIGATILSGDGNSLDPRNRNWTITETLVVSGALDTIKASGIARQTNPTAVSDGDNQRIALDDLGRQLTRPIQVRDLTLTAYATLTNGTETTLKAAVAGSYLDLIYIMGANNSDAAITVDIRAVTAGNVMMTLQIPANGTAGIACPVPLPQDETGNNWTADIVDITGTSVYLTALFSREI